MIDYNTYRTRIREAVQKRRQDERAKVEEGKPRCQHAFKHYRQTLPITNEQYQGGDAYLVVLACELCKEKRPVDYVVAK